MGSSKSFPKWVKIFFEGEFRWYQLDEPESDSSWHQFLFSLPNPVKDSSKSVAVLTVLDGKEVKK